MSQQITFASAASRSPAAEFLRMMGAVVPWGLLLLVVVACADESRREASHDGTNVVAPALPEAPDAAGAASPIQRLRTVDSTVAWEQQSVLVGDVDCDGIPDSVYIGRSLSHVAVGLVRARAVIPEVISFGVQGTVVQDDVGSNKAQLRFESLDYDPSETVGGVEGFQRSTECNGLTLGDGDSDSMHLFWNGQSQHLDWWRL